MLLSIQSLIAAPNLDDPLDQAIADHWKKDQNGAIQTAKDWTIQYANKWWAKELIKKVVATPKYKEK